MKFSSIFPVILVAGLGAAFFQCTTEDDKGTTTPPDTTKTKVVTIINPVANQFYRTSDTISIITEADYSKFASGLSIKLTVDSGKTWELIQSRVKKSGIARDTLKWVPDTDAPGALSFGTSFKLLAVDYNNKYGDTTGFIHVWAGSTY